MTQLPQLTKEHLIALVKQFKQFPNHHRDNCWRFLLALPCNEERFQEQVRAFRIAQNQECVDVPGSQQLILLAKNLTFTLDKAYPISSQTLKNRIHKVALALYRWSPSLAQCSWLSKFIFPFIKFYGVSTVSAFETCCCLLKSFEQFFIFRSFMSNRELFIINEMLCEWFVLKGERDAQRKNIDSKSPQERMNEFFACNQQNLPLKNLKSQQEFIFNLFSSFFTEQLQGDEWLKLLDHILVNGKVFFVYVLMTLFCAREMDLNFRERVDQRLLNLRKIDDLLRAAYVIYHAFNPKQCLDVYDDLLHMNQITAAHGNNYEEFDRDFPMKQLETLTFDALPEQIIMPEMNIRDVKAEVDEVSAVFGEKYGKNGQHSALERQRRKDAALLEQASQILENSRLSHRTDDADKNSKAPRQQAHKTDQAISFGETSLLGQSKQLQANKTNENEAQAPANWQETGQVHEIQARIAEEQLKQPSSPARYSRQADQDLHADQLVVPERPLTQAEIRRNVAKSHANQQVQEKLELQKRLQEIEKDYQERRAQHRTVSDRKVKVDVNASEDFTEWGQNQESDRIGSSVGATVRSRMKGIRVSKTQSGLHQESSTTLRSQDAAVNQDDLYQENEDERKIAVESVSVGNPPANMTSTDVRQSQQRQGRVDAVRNTDLKQKPIPREPQQRPTLPKATVPKQPHEQNAFKKDQSLTGSSGVSASKVQSQQTPSIMKSSSSKQATSSTNSDKKATQRPKTQAVARQIAINNDIQPAHRNTDIVDKLIEKHKQQSKQQQKAQNDADRSQESSRLTNSPAMDQLHSESSLLQADDPSQGQNDEQIRSEAKIHTPSKHPGQEKAESPIIQEIAIRRTQSSKSSSRISSFEAPAPCDKQQGKTALTREEINQLPVSENIKRKLYDLQSFDSRDERSEEIEELASAQNQEYLNILNNDSFNVDEKISHLITKIRGNSQENLERNAMQKQIDQKMEELRVNNTDDQNERSSPHPLLPVQQPTQQAQSTRADVAKTDPNAENLDEQRDSEYMQTVQRIVLPPPSFDANTQQRQSAAFAQRQTVQQNEPVYFHPEDIAISSMTQTTDSQKQTHQEIQNMLNEKKLRDGSFGYSVESSVSSKPINTDVAEQQYRQFSAQQRNQILPTQEQLVSQIGTMPRYQQVGAQDKLPMASSSSSSIMTPAKVVAMEMQRNEAPTQKSNQEKMQNLQLLSESNGPDTVFSSASLPPPSKSHQQDSSSNQKEKAHADEISVHKSSFSDSDKQAFEVQQIVDQYLLNPVGQRQVLTNSVSDSSNPDDKQFEAPEIDVRKQPNQQYNTIAAQIPQNQTKPMQQLPAPSASVSQSSQVHGNALPPRSTTKQDESAISAVNASRGENAFKAVQNASSSFDDLDYQQARYGTKTDTTAQTATGQSGAGATYSTAISQSDTSQSNFSLYLKQLQQQTKALEERLNLSQKSALVYNTERQESGVKVFSTKVLEQPHDLSVNSTATSTISAYDSDPESFIDSVKMTVQAAKGLRQESMDLKQGLRGMYEEAQRNLAQLESQISSSQ